MKIRLISAALWASVAFGSSYPAMSAETAQDFVNKAAAGGIFEVESSKAVQGKAQDEAVNEFAQKMIDDHGAANAKLQTIAGAQKLQVPKETDAKHKSDLEALTSANGSVDQSYVKMQQEAHADAVKLFQDYAADGDNAELKTFAQQTLPTLKMHQEMIEKIASTKTDSSAPTSTAPAASNDQSNASAPVPGANSFTEAQAKSRIEDAGFSNVSALTKDDKGIWRGTADKDGKQTAVALDFQGNVVAGAQ
jgi:putative membrane protein